MNPVKLTYVTSTMNKLPYLKISLERLIATKGTDEEIFVADGGSTDGTKEYLAALFKDKKIDYFISEKDYGESHALNKLFLRATGDLITLITDDDAFNHKNIQECKAFMLAHPRIDILGTDGGKKNQNLNESVRYLRHTTDYLIWKDKGTPFMCCGLGLMLRKSSLPLLGLWNPPYARADAEFMFRVTAGKANIAWYSNPSFVNISNPQSVSLTKMKQIYHETQKLEQFYLDRHFVTPIWFIESRAFLSKILRGEKKNTIRKLFTITDWEKILILSEKWLYEKNLRPGKFLYKD